MRGIKRPQLRVVPKEDLWDILDNAHTELYHAGRDRMHAYCIEHMFYIHREVTALYVRLCHTCQAIKGRKSTQKIIHKPIIPAGVGVRGQADLVDLQLSPDAGYKFILNYQDCFSKFVVLRPLRSKTADEVAQCLVHIFCEHGPPHILHTDNGAEFSNKTLLAVLHRLWSSTRIVHGRPRHPEDQGSVERANADFKNLLYARLKDENKEHNQWVGVLHYVQYSKNISYHRGINATPYSVHFGRAPPDISIDMSLPREVVLPLETEDQLEQALGSRQVIEYASQDAATPTALPSPTPIPLSHLSLQESASDMLLAAVPRPESSSPHPSCSYDLGANDYPSDPLLLDSQQADSDEDYDSPTASPLLTPVPHLLRESYDDSYDMSVRPLIGCATTPFFNLAPVSAASSSHTPPPYMLYPPDAPIPCPVCKVVDNYETTQCSYCREELPICHLSCIAFVDAYDTTVAQHFCELNLYCRSALNTARIRRDTWIALSKQGESMIESSRKRFRPLELGDNVRVPIPTVDRAPIGPLSLIGTVTDIY